MKILKKYLRIIIVGVLLGFFIDKVIIDYWFFRFGFIIAFWLFWIFIIDND